MTELEVIQSMRGHLETLFPKVCPNCKRTFASLLEYILNTKPQGPMISFDAELGEWQTQQPLGVLVLANCPCGTTLALSTEGMPLGLRQSLLKWIGHETVQRGMRPKDLLEHLRAETRRQVLSEACRDGDYKND
jgi:hypothetical protein